MRTELGIRNKEISVSLLSIAKWKHYEDFSYKYSVVTSSFSEDILGVLIDIEVTFHDRNKVNKN